MQQQLARLAPSISILRFFRSATFSPCPGCSTTEALRE
jgi:hypothetical protein